MLLTVLRAALLICSCLGYAAFFSARLHIMLVPGFLMAGIGSLMFVAGTLGFLPAAAVAVFVAGLALLVYDRLRHIRAFRDAGFLFFALCCAGLFLLLRRAEYVEWDNFSHWGLISRLLLQKNAFPDSRDGIVIFTSYPPGTAALIYYFGFITGLRGEGFQLFVQAALVLAMACGVCALARSPWTRVLALACAVILACSNIAFTSLLVDNVLAVTALCAAAFCLRCRKTLCQKAPFLLAWLVFLPAVKNSGIVLAAFVVAVLLLCARGKRAHVPALIAVSLSPLLCLLLWQARVRLVFDAAETSQHAMSVENYAAVLGEKSGDVIRQTARLMAQRVFSLSNPFWILLILFIALSAAVLVLKLKSRLILRLSVLCAAFYAVYQAGLLATYLVSMPVAEALALASYERYHGTALSLLGGMALMLSLLLYRQIGTAARRRVLAAAINAAAALALIFCLRPDFSQLRPQDLTGMLRGRLDAALAETPVPAQHSCLVLLDEDIPSSESGYVLIMSRCVLDAPYTVVKALDDPEITACWKDFHYIITMGDSPAMRQLTADLWHTEARVIHNPDR